MSAANFSALLRQRIIANNKKDLGAYSVKNGQLKLNHDWDGNTPEGDMVTDYENIEAQLDNFRAYLTKVSTIDIVTPVIASARKDLNDPNGIVDINVSADDLTSKTSKIIDTVRSINLELLKISSKVYEKEPSDLTEIRSGLKQLEESLINRFDTYSNVEQIIRNTIKDMDSEEFLLNFKSSKSIIEQLEDTIENILLNQQKAAEASFTGNLEIGNISVNLKAELKKAIAALKKAKEKISKANKRAKDIKGRFFSIVNLKELLNKKLHDQLKKNMGKGNAKTILNYRTGRFASSVYVKDVALTREGTINAFYTYMKYPYATFAKGGKQEFPPTRDPNILIAKSMREIAREIVINKLKAVPV